MAKYKSIVVTNGGLDLVAAAHNGDTIEFTAIKTGAGVYDGTEVLAEAIALKDVKQTLGISGLVKDDNVIKVRTTLSNDGLDTGYSLSELGLYAKDSSGNEILYAIVVAEPGMEDYIPTYADAPTTVTFELYVDATSYESGVTFQATVIAGTYATPQDVNDAVASMISRMGTMQTTIMQEVNTELAKKVNTADIVDNLTSTATDLPLSANQGNHLKESISPIINGKNLNNQDFNNLGKSLIGIGKNMTNDPLNNSEVIYLVQHISAYNDFAVLQYAKALNMSTEKLYFRQRKNDGTWSNWREIVTDAHIVDNLESTRTEFALSANQGNVLNSKIKNLSNRGYSLISSHDIGELTETETVYDTYAGRKFSDYDLIIITLGANNSDVRATMTLPRTIFDGSGDGTKRTIYIDCWSNSGQKFNQVCVKNVNDTQIKAWLVYSNTSTKYLNIYGVKIIDIRDL